MFETIVGGRGSIVKLWHSVRGCRGLFTPASGQAHDSTAVVEGPRVQKFARIVTRPSYAEIRAWNPVLLRIRQRQVAFLPFAQARPRHGHKDGVLRGRTGKLFDDRI